MEPICSFELYKREIDPLIVSQKIQRLFEKLYQILPLLFDFQTIRAMLTWPKFSIASYAMISTLHRQGIHPKTVIDIGANTGQFSVAAANRYPDLKVYAFEPNPEAISKLLAHTSKWPHIEIRHTAVGNQNGKADFHINTLNQTSSLLKMNDTMRYEFPHMAEKETIRVNVSTLDDIFINRPLNRPVLLKIDAQGSEKEVIEGGRKTLERVDFVVMETSFEPMYVGEPTFSEMVDIMKTFNFRIERPIAFMKSLRTGKILQTDILFKKANGLPEIHE